MNWDPQTAKDILKKINEKISTAAQKISESNLGRKFEISPLFAQRGIFSAGVGVVVLVVATSVGGSSYSCDSGGVKEDVFEIARKRYKAEIFNPNNLVSVAIQDGYGEKYLKIVKDNEGKIDQRIVPDVVNLEKEKLKVIDNGKYSLSAIRTISIDEKLRKSTCEAKLTFKSGWGSAEIQVSYRAATSSDGVIVFLDK